MILFWHWVANEIIFLAIAGGAAWCHAKKDTGSHTPWFRYILDDLQRVCSLRTRAECLEFEKDVTKKCEWLSLMRLGLVAAGCVLIFLVVLSIVRHTAMDHDAQEQEDEADDDDNDEEDERDV